MKACIVILLIVFSVISLAFIQNKVTAYQSLYTEGIEEFKLAEANLLRSIEHSSLDNSQGIDSLKSAIALARLKLKDIDFWLRYYEPNAYRKINGPLPVEWENEVFEKFEAPYRREGAGLSLAEISLSQKSRVKDSLIALIRRSQEAIKTYEADSITSQLKTFSSFFLANRLFLLNLAAVYNTGFECPDTSRVLPEMVSMLTGTRRIYESYNQSFPEKRLSAEYLAFYDGMIAFIRRQNGFSSLDRYVFIRDYVNPLFRMNQEYILGYDVKSISFNDYTLNNDAKSIFDKFLYTPQNTKGIFSLVEDEKTLSRIRAIGKLLFFDPILSGNNKRSCASCHKPTQYFTDTVMQTAMSYDGEHHLTRNTPTLINAVYNHLLMLDGKHTTLQSQAKAVITNPDEMGSEEKQLIRKVMSCKEYRDAFKQFLKYTPEEKQVTMDHIVSAITFYDGSYSRFYSPFDEAMNKKADVTSEVKDGFNLFMSRAKCGTCHFVPNFNGVKPPYIGSEFEVLGTPETADFRSLSPDKGRFMVNQAPETLHAFRTGSIRNAAFTGPYMHNGIFKSLDEVIDFYDAGGGEGKKMIVENQTLSGDSLKLSKKDKKELLAFIYSLNEDVIFEEAPLTLPASSDPALNERKVGGQY